MKPPARRAKCAEIASTLGHTHRQREILTLLTYGQTSKEIARQLKISPQTVKAYLYSLMRRVDVLHGPLSH